MRQIITLRQLRAASERLDLDTVSADPFEQFGRWYGQAKKTSIFQPDSMTLATSTADGEPSARMVLLSEFDQRGFVFFTSYDSRKGKIFDGNPRAALVFWWSKLFRQVRIEGTVSKLTQQENEGEFQGRPRNHQIALSAWCQSEPVESRKSLTQRFKRVKARYRKESNPVSPSFGGYRLDPGMIDFWQGRRDWIHDWLKYSRRVDGSWLIERLAP